MQDKPVKEECLQTQPGMSFDELVEGILELIPEIRPQYEKAKAQEPSEAQPYMGVKHPYEVLGRVSDVEGGIVVLLDYMGKDAITVRWSHPEGSYEYLSQFRRYIGYQQPKAAQPSAIEARLLQALERLSVAPARKGVGRELASDGQSQVIEQFEKVDRFDGSEFTWRCSGAQAKPDGTKSFEGLERIERFGKIEKIEKMEKFQRI